MSDHATQIVLALIEHALWPTVWLVALLVTKTEIRDLVRALARLVRRLHHLRYKSVEIHIADLDPNVAEEKYRLPPPSSD